MAFSVLAKFPDSGRMVPRREVDVTEIIMPQRGGKNYRTSRDRREIEPIMFSRVFTNGARGIPFAGNSGYRCVRGMCAIIEVSVSDGHNEETVRGRR